MWKRHLPGVMLWTDGNVISPDSYHPQADPHWVNFSAAIIFHSDQECSHVK